ncbi:hypothetical protein DUNSADRAFT_15641 [Dunaliella salina]|uniref:Encoded protein n=1 Tax=Dunaliella salina TaxID=3046 RepID=A0ABQ7G527_DUNSA|nr:hypothetical protein DUNSADRAFT_15641 [Dunaliella salina]|eukprot:KAF5829705.1 hypothetical protein DUNSADRAFT_15641 [Dunaliella salina]
MLPSWPAHLPTACAFVAAQHGCLRILCAAEQSAAPRRLDLRQFKQKKNMYRERFRNHKRGKRGSVSTHDVKGRKKRVCRRPLASQQCWPSVALATRWCAALVRVLLSSETRAAKLRGNHLGPYNVSGCAEYAGSVTVHTLRGRKGVTVRSLRARKSIRVGSKGSRHQERVTFQPLRSWQLFDH